MFTLTGVGVPIAFGSTQYFTAMQNVGQVKSFVDDLVMKLGTVSMRVALVLRSAEVQPVFQDLFIQLLDDNSSLPFPLLIFFPFRYKPFQNGRVLSSAACCSVRHQDGVDWNSGLLYLIRRANQPASLA